MTKYHFIGIGGIGMSALARIALQRGDDVQGTDASPSALLEELAREGVRVRIGHDPDWVQTGMTVVYSTDIKPNHSERARALMLGVPLLHRSDLLDQFLRERKVLLVTGTHGKTTTTALLASVLMGAAMDPPFMVGGILRSQGINGSWGQGPYFVAEADESDGSFLKTPSDGAIVTNLEPEHLDYWGNEERLILGFRQFFAQSRKAIWCRDDPRLTALCPQGISYGFSREADVVISHYRPSSGGILFDLSMQGVFYRDIHLALLGQHNALNGAAVFALTSALQIPEEKIRSALQCFSGTKRRLEKKGEIRDVAVYDDYGHHPTEIIVTLRALRQEIGARRLFVLFQPHRYTRLRDCFDLFLHAFDEVDELVITDLYAAREEPILGISADRFYEEMRKVRPHTVHRIARTSLESEILQKVEPGDVVLTLGAGDITSVSERLIEQLPSQ